MYVIWEKRTKESNIIHHIIQSIYTHPFQALSSTSELELSKLVQSIYPLTSHYLCPSAQWECVYCTIVYIILTYIPTYIHITSTNPPNLLCKSIRVLVGVVYVMREKKVGKEIR